MQTTLENLGGLERRLRIAVPAAEIEQEVETRLKHLTRTTKLAGFRPGKVPFRVVSQHYGRQVRQEVLGDRLERNFGAAVQAERLRVAGFPRFEPEVQEGETAEVAFNATFEVYPEVQIGDLGQTAIQRPVLEPGDAEVDKTLDILRRQRTRFEPVERLAAAGDQVTLDYQGVVDGQELPETAGRDQSIILGKGHLLKDFEDQVIGMGSGQTRRFELSFPADYHGKAVAGKTAVFDVTVKQVAAPVLPDLAELARSLGLPDEDVLKLREGVADNMRREIKQRIAARVKEQAMDALLAATSLTLPRALIEMEIRRLAAGAKKDLEARGVKTKNLDLPRELFETQAVRRVSLGLILAELVQNRGLQAKPEEVRAMVEEYAQHYEQPEELVRWYYQSPERLRDVESLVLENNVVEWVLSQAKVEDRPVTFEELMGAA